METIYLNQLLHRIKINNLIDFTETIHDWRLKGFGKILDNRLAVGAEMDYGDLVFLSETAYGSLLRQAIIFVYEYSKNNEKSLPQKEKNNFRNLKTKICNDQSLQTIDIEKLLKIMRDSIAHNSDAVKYPNARIDLHDNVSIKKKVNKKQNLNLELTPENINEFLFMCSHYVQNPKFSKSTIAIDKDILVEKLKNDKLKIMDIPKIVEYYDENQQLITLDCYQIKCLFNTFNNYSKYITGEHKDECISFILGKFPFKDNCIGNLQYVQRAGKFVNSLKFNKEYSEYKIVGEKNVQNLERLMTIREIEATLYLNALFCIFSISSPQDLKIYFSKFNYSDQGIIHLRNSIMHGRYYYNENNAFEMYDGENDDDLSHCFTLKCNDLKNVARDVVLSRIKEIQQESNKK